MTFVLFWVVFAVLVAVYAKQQRPERAGLLLDFAASGPLIGFVFAVVSPPIREKVAQKSGLKKCTECGEAWEHFPMDRR